MVEDGERGRIAVVEQPGTTDCVRVNTHITTTNSNITISKITLELQNASRHRTHFPDHQSVLRHYIQQNYERQLELHDITDCVCCVVTRVMDCVVVGFDG